jgi:hypothetical protein
MDAPNRFDYLTAFCRNIGIVSEEEQAGLRDKRVALAGLGGVGGIYAQALARLGVGRFSIADGDVFEVANFNRQMGGNLSTLGCNKARALERQIHEINPEAVVDVSEEHLTEANIATFLHGVDLVVDGMDAFSIPPHRMLLREARARTLAAFVAAPLGFSAGAVVFGPAGMSADEYFDWHDGQCQAEQVINLALGLAPSFLHRANFDLRRLSLSGKVGPSNIAACLLCAGIMATEATRLLLGRDGARFAPISIQFDPYSARLQRSRLRWGLRGPLMRIRRRISLALLARNGMDANPCLTC